MIPSLGFMVVSHDPFSGANEDDIWGEGLVGGFFPVFKFHDPDDFALAC